MHDNILPFLENNRQSSHTPNGYSFLQEIYSRTISSQCKSTHTRTDTQQTLDNVTPLLPETGSVTPKVMRMLNDDSDQLSKNLLPTEALYTVPYSQDRLSSCHSSAIFRNKIMNVNKMSTHDKDDNQRQSVHNTSGIDMSTSSVHNTSGSEMSTCSGRSISPRSFEYQASSDTSFSAETSSLSDTQSSVDSFPLSDTPLSVDSFPLGDTPSTVDSSTLSDTPLSIESSPSSAASLNADSQPSSAELSSLVSSKTRKLESLDNDEQPRKKGRTNYTNEQIQTLLKIFHETPYPDSEMMENIGKDLGIPEKKVKIWFQNKRARWRRRVNDNRNIRTENLLPMSPVGLPPYAYVPTGHMMTSSPIQNVSGYYPWMQSCFIPNKNLNLHGQFSTNLQGANGAASVYPFVSLPSSQNNGAQSQQRMSFVPTLPSSQYSGTLSQHRMTSFAPTSSSSQYSGTLSQHRMTSFAPTSSSSQYSGTLSQHRMTSFIPTMSSQYTGVMSQQRLASEQTKHPSLYPPQVNASTYSPGS